MKREIKAIEYECEGCGRTVATAVDDDPPEGYHGNVTLIAGGAETAEFFACKVGCIRPAIIKALKRASSNDEED